MLRLSWLRIIVVALTVAAVSAAVFAFVLPLRGAGRAYYDLPSGVVILAFVGWEAIAPLTPRFHDPARQLPRVIAIAFVVTAVVFLGLAAAPTAVLGAAAGPKLPQAAE